VTDTPNTETAVQEDRLAAERAFIADLVKLDKGKLAVLRRNAGNLLSEAKGVYWFHGLLAGQGQRLSEEACFLVATLAASDKDAIGGRNRFTGNFGATCRALRNVSGRLPSEPSPLDRRFNTLLDADFDSASGGELSFRLRQMTKRIIAEKDPSVRINWPQLLRDVRFWNSGRKLTQKQWARSYYAPALASQETTEPASSEG
jgi:CRISPR type I-E-associated protein CasB/Cse2